MPDELTELVQKYPFRTNLKSLDIILGDYAIPTTTGTIGTLAGAKIAYDLTLKYIPSLLIPNTIIGAGLGMLSGIYLGYYAYQLIRHPIKTLNAVSDTLSKMISYPYNAIKRFFKKSVSDAKEIIKERLAKE